MVQSFGIVTVTTAGTPVRASSNVTVETGEPIPLQTVKIQAHPSNSAVGYVFAGMTTPAADHRTDGVGLIGVVAAPVSATQGPFATVEFTLPATPNGINLRNIWLDAGSSAQKFIVSGTVG